MRTCYRWIGCVEKGTMLRVNQHRFYELGMKVHPLTTINESAEVKLWFFILWEAREAVIDLFGQGYMLFRVCRPAAEKLVSAISNVIAVDFNEAAKALSSEDTLGYKHYRIKEAAQEFETVLGAEVQALDTYFISQKGSYSTPDLIDHAEIIFPESIRIHLPQHAISDIREAGRCLALDTPTACGFHILRAVEAVMAEYYALVVQKPIPTRMRNWGIYIKKLREHGANPKIIQMLDHIREEYRNPIAHPDVILELDEVEVLLGVASGVIRQIVLESAKLMTAQLQLNVSSGNAIAGSASVSS